MSLTRRRLVLGLPAPKGACATLPKPQHTARHVRMPGQSAALGHYGEIEDDGSVVPGVDLSEIDRQSYRQIDAFTGREAPGTVVVDPDERFLFLVQPGGQALRYGVGVGREGFGWNGAAAIGTLVSSGCIRMIDQDAIDLYGRVPTGSRVVVRPHLSARGSGER